jgi:hypothetical protein
MLAKNDAARSRPSCIMHRPSSQSHIAVRPTPAAACRLDVINVDLLVRITISVLVELDIVVDALVAVGIRLVDLCTLRKFAVGLEGTGFVGRVFEDDVALFVLVVAQGQQDDVSLVDPDLLPQLAADVCQSLLAVKAEGLQAPVAQHLQHLGVLLPFFLERQLALLVVVFVLSSTPIFTSLLTADVLAERVFCMWEIWRGMRMLGGMRCGVAGVSLTFPLFLGILKALSVLQRCLEDRNVCVWY